MRFSKNSSSKRSSLAFVFVGGGCEKSITNELFYLVTCDARMDHKSILCVHRLNFTFILLSFSGFCLLLAIYSIFFYDVSFWYIPVSHTFFSLLDSSQYCDRRATAHRQVHLNNFIKSEHTYELFGFGSENERERVMAETLKWATTTLLAGLHPTLSLARSLSPMEEKQITVKNYDGGKCENEIFFLSPTFTLMACSENVRKSLFEWRAGGECWWKWWELYIFFKMWIIVVAQFAMS